MLNNGHKTMKVKFDLIICDEAHIGGTTTNFKKMIAALSHKNTKVMFVTATFKKPQLEYDIPDDRCVMFGVHEVSCLMNKEDRDTNQELVSEIKNVLGRKIEQSVLEHCVY